MNGPDVVVVAFWSCAAIIGFTYIGYPLALMAVSRLWGRAAVVPDQQLPERPAVSLLIVAHNEEETIAERLENALGLDYPQELLEIVVATDASTDRTDDIVRSFAHRGVTLKTFSPRMGKAAILNRTIPTLRGSIVMLSDANTFTAPDAAHKFARWFHDPAIGVVCGRLQLVDRARGTNVDGLYWSIETALKEREARLGAIIGANGANYALRRTAFVPIPDDTIADDLVIPLQARLHHGCAIVFDREALAVEETAPEVELEFGRRVRLGAAGFQAIRLLWPLLNPLRGSIAWSFFCHKVLRWLCPVFMAGLLLSNVFLAGRPSYALALAAQAALHLGGIAGFWWKPDLPLPRMARLGVMFYAMNVALLVGLWRWSTNRQPSAWARTPRRRLATSAEVRE